MVGFLGPRPLCPPHSENPNVQARAALVVGGSWVRIFLQGFYLCKRRTESVWTRRGTAIHPRRFSVMGGGEGSVCVSVFGVRSAHMDRLRDVRGLPSRSGPVVC